MFRALAGVVGGDAVVVALGRSAYPDRRAPHRPSHRRPARSLPAASSKVAIKLATGTARIARAQPVLEAAQRRRTRQGSVATGSGLQCRVVALIGVVVQVLMAWRNLEYLLA